MGTPGVGSERKLAPNTLEKALLLKVPGCGGEDRESPLDSTTVLVWVGWLRAGFEKWVEFSAGADPSFEFVVKDGTKCLPYAHALVDAANEKFALKELQDPQPMEARLTAMEEQFATMQSGLEELLAMQRGGDGFVSAQDGMEEAPAAGAATRSKPPKAKVQVKAPPGLGTAFSYPGLDPGTVTAARQAGIPEGQLQQMANLLSSRPNRLEDFPRPNVGEALFGEIDDDLDEEEPAVLDVESSDPMGKAILKLTSIVDSLARRRAETVEEGIDDVSSGVSGLGESGSNLGKKHALLRQSLQRTFLKNPEKIWQVIERNMEAEYHLSPALPGAGATGFTARGWAEHRSRIMGYARTVRSAWGVAGILDSLRAGNHHQARARACLMLAQYEQESLDHGSYVLAQEFSMESPPPLSSFQAHSLPDPVEMSATRLMNQQWVEAYADRLKQVDSYIEMRRKLNQRGKSSGEGQGKGDGKSSKGKSEKGKGKTKKAEKAEEGAD